MNSDIASLHKILKDATRRKIIILLNEQGRISYVDLMKALGIVNTGKMNYHLKILDDLLTKDEDGKYALTEKGKLASRLLLEFPEEHNQSEGVKISWRNVAWVVLSNASYLSIIIYLWFRGYVSINWLVSSIIVFAVATITIFLVKTQMPTRRTHSPKRMMLGTKIVYVTFGAIAGILICWLGGGLIIAGLVTLLRSAGIPVRLFSFDWWVIISWTIGALVGGLVGYLLYKRSKYSNIAHYNPLA